MKSKNHPGVYVPPPLIYAVFFFSSVVLDRVVPFGDVWLNPAIRNIFGIIFISCSLFAIIPALQRFFVTKNTLITIKPASSLQTTGIYAYSRNPMYLGLANLYTGLAVFFGNPWTFLLLPALILVIYYFVIRKEEQYLHHAFGEQYVLYKSKVRRWI